MDKFTLTQIQRTMAAKSCEFFDGNKPYNLNLIGIRSNADSPDMFDDIFLVIYRDKNLSWTVEQFTCTTNPGLRWLKEPGIKEGTAVLLPGQYKGMWATGYHKNDKNEYALRQVKPVKFTRDNDKDEKSENFGKIYNQVIGLNCHNASNLSISKIIGLYSAGCQVLNNPEQHKRLMHLCDISKRLYGDSFTYTLLLESDIK
jgi:hypothetical protein